MSDDPPSLVETLDKLRGVIRQGQDVLATADNMLGTKRRKLPDQPAPWADILAAKQQAESQQSEALVKSGQ